MWFLLATTFWAGCVGESTLPPLSAPYDQAFTEEFRVELDTIPEATLGQVSDVLVLDDQILVTDQMSDRVVAFSMDGAFGGAIGRHGEGPGEFRDPQSLVEASDGTILVADVSPRLTRIGKSLELLGVFTVPEWPWVGHLARVGEDIILFQPSNRSEGENFHRWSIEGGLDGAFDRRSDLVLSVPYWNATWTTHIAVSSNHVFCRR
ncbi:6-bladed beta-propeller [Gaopeijia maritima]|uniref:6-bladed beta-propeller n=1 Tax=Gaopeijia maritima TaxID=3119007 RepID=A0ABU9EB28_9BACT